MPTVVATSGHSVSFAHRILWDSSRRHLSLAGLHQADSWQLHLSAGLLAAAAFEGYLNYLGQELLPALWENERASFSTPPYRGVNGKLRRIAEEVEWPLPPRSRKPFAGLAELQSLRDKMVHAKPKRENFRRVHKEGEFGPGPGVWLHPEFSDRRVLALISDTEAVAVLLHNAVLKSSFRNVAFLGKHPFLGATGYGLHSVEPAG